MSQVDSIHFFPVLFWVVVLFVVWYSFVVSLIVPKYYKVLRSRVQMEKLFYSFIKQDDYLLRVLKIFFYNWVKQLVFLFNVNMLVNFGKVNVEGKLLGKNYAEVDNINEVGFVFKVSDDIAYARGLLKIQMSEMAKSNNKSLLYRSRNRNNTKRVVQRRFYHTSLFIFIIDKDLRLKIYREIIKDIESCLDNDDEWVKLKFSSEGHYYFHEKSNTVLDSLDHNEIIGLVDMAIDTIINGSEASENYSVEIDDDVKQAIALIIFTMDELGLLKELIESFNKNDDQ